MGWKVSKGDVSMPDLAPLRPDDPERVREYRLVGRLGEGGQGTVFLGMSPSGSRVAVKLLRADLAQDEEALERFVREVSTTRRVSAFCTAAVIDTGIDQHRPYIVSEYVDGPTLSAVVAAEGPRSGAALHRLAIGTVTALIAIHQAGIVHRDFKPSNVLLASDGPRVIDFGIARALDGTSTLTATAIGTPSYMAPEQYGGTSPASPADMFAWGCTMVFAATGKSPFGADSLPAIFNRIMHLEPDLRAITDGGLRELVGQCLSKDPALRPTAREALLRLLGHAEAAETPEGAKEAEGTPQSILSKGSAAARQPDADVQPPSRQTGADGAQLPHPAPAPPEGRRRGVQIAIGAGLAVTLVTAAGMALASSGARQNPTTQPSTSPSGATASTPPALPPATRTIKLPDSPITLYESDDDPIKLTSYDTAQSDNIYVRKPGTADFVENAAYFEYAMNASGTRALATDRTYDDRYTVVSVVGGSPGSAERIKVVKAPVYSFEPQWSPDGTRGLTTLYEVAKGAEKNDKVTFKRYGYAVIDVERKKADVVRMKGQDETLGGYFWRRDGQAIGTWVVNDDSQYIRFYDLQGAVVQTLPDVGLPLRSEGESISPSGTLLTTYCWGTAEVCVWSTGADAKAHIKTRFEGGRFIGWWDEQHVAGWRRASNGYEAVVLDFQGQVKRVLAVVADAKDFDKLHIRFSRVT
ncbi:protein kinase [Nonomuraea sp. NPDC049758]|uniref:serine/threonine protein kinase n=1 Tax=Nonomuraea sp. NPDC049758 TaxID=3154360 RepID=UPI003445667C